MILCASLGTTAKTSSCRRPELPQLRRRHQGYFSANLPSLRIGRRRWPCGLNCILPSSQPMLEPTAWQFTTRAFGDRQLKCSSSTSQALFAGHLHTTCNGASAFGQTCGPTVPSKWPACDKLLTSSIRLALQNTQDRDMLQFEAAAAEAGVVHGRLRDGSSSWQPSVPARRARAGPGAAHPEVARPGAGPGRSAGRRPATAAAPRSPCAPSRRA